MSDYTYEFERHYETRETYEWDNVWWDQANVKQATRVLYIGDSISCATRRVATQVSGNTLLFDGFGTSKAVDNPYFMKSLRLFAEQEGERHVVLFNNGLHGWHLEDQSDYARAYEDFLVQLLEEFKGTPEMLLLTTHVADGERDKRVQVRNEGVSALAKKYDLPVIDLYSVTKEHAELLSSDGVHLLPEGYRLLAEALVDRVKEQLS